MCACKYIKANEKPQLNKSMLIHIYMQGNERLIPQKFILKTFISYILLISKPFYLFLWLHTSKHTFAAERACSCFISLRSASYLLCSCWILPSNSCKICPFSFWSELCLQIVQVSIAWFYYPYNVNKTVFCFSKLKITYSNQTMS